MFEKFTSPNYDLYRDALKEFALEYEGVLAVRVAVAGEWIYDNEPLLARLIVKWHSRHIDAQEYRKEVIQDALESNMYEFEEEVDAYAKREGCLVDDNMFERDESALKETLEDIIFQIIY